MKTRTVKQKSNELQYRSKKGTTMERLPENQKDFQIGLFSIISRRKLENYYQNEKKNLKNERID